MSGEHTGDESRGVPSWGQHQRTVFCLKLQLSVVNSLFVKFILFPRVVACASSQANQKFSFPTHPRLSQVISKTSACRHQVEEDE